MQRDVFSSIFTNLMTASGLYICQLIYKAFMEVVILNVGNLFSIENDNIVT